MAMNANFLNNIIVIRRTVIGYSLQGARPVVPVSGGAGNCSGDWPPR